MILCLNPDCKAPRNLDGASHCQSCGSQLRLRNRYRPIEALAQGGFGRTYLAVDEDRLDTPCAIKQLLPQSSGTEIAKETLDKMIDLFFQEATQLSKLGEHPQIPTLLAFFEQDAQMFLVQEYIDGETLWHEMDREGPFSEQQVKQVLVQLLPILKFVHHHNVVHRDITPVNILRRRRDDRLVLIDFGVAKQLSHTAMAQPGTKVGTVGYAPIEQLRSGQAYPASDIYSLGVTCLHLLTKTRPDSLFDPLHGWRWKEILAKRGQSISPRLAYILEKMTRDMVADRYQSIDEIIRDFKAPGRAKKAQATQAQAARGSQRSVSGGSSSRAGAAASVPSSAPRPPATPRSSSSTGRSRPPASRPQTTGGRSRTPSSAPTSAETRTPNPRTPSGRPIAPISQVPPTGRDSAWQCMAVFETPSSVITSVALSDNGMWAVGGCVDNSVQVWNLRDNVHAYTLQKHRKAVNAVAIAPNSMSLATGSDDAIVHLWNLKTGDHISSIDEHLRDVTSLAFFPDGATLASGSKDRSTILHAVKPGGLVSTLATKTGTIKAIAVSGDGRYLVSGGLDNKLYLWDVEAKALINTLTGHLNSVLSVDISRDGKTIVSGSKDRTIRTWDVQTGELTGTLTGHLWDVNAVKFLPDGRHFVSASSDKTVKLWSMRTQKPFDTLGDHLGAVHGLDVSRDGRTIVTGSWDKTLRVWSRVV
ncbi:MAG: protein kinase [Geitlerinemataceae cyanobacterium]